MKKIVLLLAILSGYLISYSQVENAFTNFKTDAAIVYGMCFSHFGGILAIGDNRDIKIYSVKSGILLDEYRDTHRAGIMTIDISSDSTLMVSGGKDSLIVIRDLIHNRILNSLEFQKGIVTSVQFSPDCHYIVSGGSDHKVFLYDVINNKVMFEFSESNDDITSVAFSPDGKLIASAGGDKLIYIHEAENGKLIAKLKGHRSWVRDLSFCKDGRKLISCSDDRKIIIWDMHNLNYNNIIIPTDIRAGWLLSIDSYNDYNCYAYAELNGHVSLVSNTVQYDVKIGVPVNRIRFQPNCGQSFKIALATRGKGVILLDANKMKLVH